MIQFVQQQLSLLIGQLAARTLGPFSVNQGQTFYLPDAPPHVRLSPNMAITLNLAFHELATNALKYGALSVAQGHVKLSWEIKSGTPLRVNIVWEELGGPAVEPPQKQGFGTRLLERSMSRELRGWVKLQFLPKGVRCEIEMPL